MGALNFLIGIFIVFIVLIRIITWVYRDKTPPKQGLLFEYKPDNKQDNPTIEEPSKTADDSIWRE